MNSPWPTTTIGDLFSIGAGKSVTPAARHGQRKHPFLRTANVFWGRLALNEVDAMHFSDEEIAAKSLQKGDLLVCEGGDIGRSAIWNGEIADCSFQNHLHRLRPKADDIIPRFYMYFLQAGFTQLGIYAGAGNKTTIPNLSRSRLAALEVPRLPKPEQEKITAVLWKVQRAIEVEENLILAARELKQSTIHQLFTHGLRKNPEKEGEFRSLPQTWKVIPLGECCSFTTGKLNSNAAVDGGEYPFFTCSQTTARIDTYSFDQECILLAGNNAQGVYSLKYYNGKFDAYQRTYILTINDVNVVDYRFLLYELSRKLEELKISSLGTVTKYLTATIISKLKVTLPNIDEQREIARILRTVDDKISVHERKRATLEELFKTLLHQLMTGQIRVANLDVDVSEIQS